MDDVDYRLVTLLRANARASWAELARAVGLSAPSVADRVTKLERDGVIVGYHAAVQPDAVGLAVSAVVGVYQREGIDQESMINALRDVDAIEDCWHVAGEEELLVRVRVPDVAALESTLSRLRRVPGVSRTRTTVVLSAAWEGRFPLAPAAQPATGAADPDALPPS